MIRNKQDRNESRIRIVFGTAKAKDVPHPTVIAAYDAK